MKEPNKNSHIKMKRLKRIHNLSRHKKHSVIPFLPFIVILFISIATIGIVNIARNPKYAGGYSNPTNEITSISFESDDWGSNGSGSWHLDKSTKWTSVDTAQVDFLINTNAKKTDNHLKDIILVLDLSRSMEGEKLEKVKENSKALVEELLSRTGNRVSLVVFDTNAEVKSYFVDNSGKDTVIDLIDGLSASGSTNYNDALKKLENVLINDNYTPKSDTDLIALFLADGHPQTDTSKELATYRNLKDKYPYLTINGIAYETGLIPSELAKISEKQFLANTNSLKNVLFEASYSIESYENFQVIDYIEDEYFYVKDKDDIKVSTGTVELINEDNNQKIVWTLGSEYTTGRSASMSIKLYLKEEYINDKNKDLYSSNKGEKVVSKLHSDAEKEKESSLTPVIKRLYDVVYESNAPSGCNDLDILTIEQHQAFENVNMNSKKLTCSGYLFEGWEIITEDVQKVNSDTFQMPTKKVNLRAKWLNIPVADSMISTASTSPTLYNIVKSNANKTNELVTDVYNKTETADIYYYTSKENNNVLYAGFCWQIVRTTTTGGVKLIYNGAPDSNGTCTIDPTNAANRKTGIGSQNGKEQWIGSEYWYGDSFDWDANTKTFTLEGNKFKGDYSSDNNKEKYIGKYTCMSTDENGACSLMYYMSSVGTSDNYAYVVPYGIGDGLSHAVIANSDFNANINSLAFVGYMYNTTYTSDYLSSSSPIYANDVTWNTSTMKYELSSDRSDSYDDTHHYVCNDSSCSSVKFVYSSLGVNTIYYIVLENGKKIDDALYDMIGYIDSSSSNKPPNANLNKYNSDAKAMIDWWFGKYIEDHQDDVGNSYANYLEDVVYCNNRSISDLAGWSPNGSISPINPPLLFNFHNFFSYNNEEKFTLECPNVTDRFSTSNTYAKLKYPVGLLTPAEANLMTSSFRAAGGFAYWLSAPSELHSNTMAEVGAIYGYGGFLYGHNTDNGNMGLRPAVSLKPGTKISEGDGTIGNPFVIGEPSENPNPNPNPNPENPDVYTVSYKINGVVPDGYEKPSDKEYSAGELVNLDIMKKGDVFNGYIFQGWKVETPSDLIINTTDNDFVMPEENVVLVGEFIKITYKVEYQFTGDIIPPNADALLPDTEYYEAGTNVTLKDVKGRPTGYYFLGWYSENPFTMPEENVIIYGEWREVGSTIKPTITKEIIDKKEEYREGDTVKYKITVTNTANYDIKDVKVVENNQNAYFINGTGYEVTSAHLVTIDTINANSSATLYAEYKVTENDIGTIENIVEISSVTTDNDDELDPDGDYTDKEEFKKKDQSKLKICKNVDNLDNNKEFTFNIVGDNKYELGIRLSNGECKTMIIDSGAYTVTEIVPQEYEIKNVEGAITSNGGEFEAEAGKNYTIIFTNTFKRKGFYHSSGEVPNKVKAR